VKPRSRLGSIGAFVDEAQADQRDRAMNSDDLRDELVLVSGDLAKRLVAYRRLVRRLAASTHPLSEDAVTLLERFGDDGAEPGAIG
jgi:hypothetical protein